MVPFLCFHIQGLEVTTILHCSNHFLPTRGCNSHVHKRCELVKRSHRKHVYTHGTEPKKMVVFGKENTDRRDAYLVPWWCTPPQSFRIEQTVHSEKRAKFCINFLALYYSKDPFLSPWLCTTPYLNSIGIKQFHLVCTFIIWCLFLFLSECSENSLGAVVILPLLHIGFL